MLIILNRGCEDEKSNLQIIRLRSSCLSRPNYFVWPEPSCNLSCFLELLLSNFQIELSYFLWLHRDQDWFNKRCFPTGRCILNFGVFNAIYYFACQQHRFFFYIFNYLVVRWNKSFPGEKQHDKPGIYRVWYSNAQIENRVMNIFVRL